VQHPEFASNPLYIGGDSYSGITVPVTALEMANHNPNGELNLKGYMVGNGLTDKNCDDGGRFPFMHGMGLISNELYEGALGSRGLGVDAEDHRVRPGAAGHQRGYL
jgi:serine carboxypeptidase-like clade 1